MNHTSIRPKETPKTHKRRIPNTQSAAVDTPSALTELSTEQLDIGIWEAA